MPEVEKYTAEQRKQIVTWFATGDGIPLVVQRIREEFGIEERNLATLWANYNPNSKKCPKKWKRYARLLRRVLSERIDLIPITHRARRLQLLNEAAEEGMMWRTKSINEFGEVQERRVGATINAVEQARRELGEDDGDGARDLVVSLVDALRDLHKRRLDLEPESTGKIIDVTPEQPRVALMANGSNGDHAPQSNGNGTPDDSADPYARLY